MRLTSLLPLIVLGWICWHSRGAIEKRVTQVSNLKENYVVGAQMSRILNQIKLQSISDDNFHVTDIRQSIRSAIRSPTGGDPSVDPWGTAYRHRLVGSKLFLYSAGADRKWNTEDDSWDSVDLQDY